MVASRAMTLTKVSLVFLKPSSRRSFTLPLICSQARVDLLVQRSLEGLQLLAVPGELVAHRPAQAVALLALSRGDAVGGIREAASQVGEDGTVLGLAIARHDFGQRLHAPREAKRHRERADGRERGNEDEDEDRDVQTRPLSRRFLARGALALVLEQVALAQADGLGRDFDQLVVVDELDRRLPA